MEVAYANSARLVLAMPNATCDERVGRLFRLHASAGLPEGLSAMRLACRQPDASLRPMPEKAPPWSALVAVDDYVLPLSRLVHQFKFSSQIALAQPLARLLLLAVLQARRTRGLPPVDTLVNVPLFQRRHWRRGYNQSDLLCRPLAHWLGCRYPASALKRIHATAVQHRLNARSRKGT